MDRGKQKNRIARRIIRLTIVLMTLAVALALPAASALPAVSTLQVTYGRGDAVYANAITFADVSAEHWAKENIDFAAAGGIVNGYYDAYSNIYTFRPENNVSYEEAATMLHRAMVKAGLLAELSDEEKATLIEKYQTEFDENSISEWARPYVAGLLQKNVIEPESLDDFVDENGLGQPAPREIVAVWTAKSMEKNYGAVYYLPYVDAAEISPNARPFIDVLYRHEVMKGSLQLDQTVAFMPKAGVKRCEFAAIANRVYENIGRGYDIDREAVMYASSDGLDLNKLYFAEDVLLVTSAEAGDGDSVKSGAGLLVTEVHGQRDYGLGKASFVLSSFTGKLMDGEAAAEQLPQLHIDFYAAKGSGEISSVQTLISDGGEASARTVLGIKIDKREIFYILDSNTQNSARIREGEKISFLADGLYLLEIK